MVSQSRILARLKDCFGPSVRLSTHVAITTEADAAHVFLKQPSGNMQTDAGAFEAWAMALHVCGFRKVHLSWNHGAATARLHYNRFLYRLEAFAMLFEWFRCDTPPHSPFPASGAPLFLNHGAVTASAKKSRTSESAFEEQLYRSPAFRREHDLAEGHLARQLPVGVFASNPPGRDSAVFPFGSAAIDLVGVDRGNTLKLFELKVSKNRKLGAFSELFFYSRLLEDVRQGRIVPTSTDTLRDSALTWETLANTSGLENHIISSGQVHPLVRGICESDSLGPFPASCTEMYRFESYPTHMRTE